MKKFTLLLTIVLTSFISCSKDSLNEDEEVILSIQECEIEDADEGCQVVYLEGDKFGWTKISSATDLEKPYFLYADGKKEEPKGTITITMNVRSPVIRINDFQVDDVLVQVSQASNGQNKICKIEENIIPPTSSQEPKAQIKFSEQFDYPFYLKINSNICVD